MGLSLSSQPTLSHGFATIILSYILKHRGCIREIVAISLYNNILYVTLRASERSLKKDSDVFCDKLSNRLASFQNILTFNYSMGAFLWQMIRHK